jgi:type II restriction enzyme
MNLCLPTEGLAKYKSASQRARVCTEPWGLANLYCPACASARLESLPTNTPAHDFKCPSCSNWFQLKSKSSSFGYRIQDGAFDSMRRAILRGDTPNLFLLRYTRPELYVRDVTLIPYFVLTLSVLEQRKPLSPNAKRAGWSGCNFLLDRIPPDAQIAVVRDGEVKAAQIVRSQYDRLRPLEKINIENRGWTLDVLKAVRSLSKANFSLSEIYALEDSLAAVHPKNSHIRPKIRQQLQVLRDLGLITFLGNGTYRLR